jgi:hypothetical protein
VIDPPARARRHAGEACVLEQAHERVEAVEPGSFAGLFDRLRAEREVKAGNRERAFLCASERATRRKWASSSSAGAPGCSWTSASRAARAWRLSPTPGTRPRERAIAEWSTSGTHH